jgi:SprT-like protein
MENEELQRLLEQVSLDFFAKPFLHQATFNTRLQTTGGRYLLRSHNIEMNPKQLQMHGMDEMIAIIKHELCHYHLHIEKRGYQHKDHDFMELLKRVGGSRYCKTTGVRRSVQTRHIYQCNGCAKRFERKRKVNTRIYRCAACMGSLRLLSSYRLS